jgi:hypothetical protein
MDRTRQIMEWLTICQVYGYEITDVYEDSSESSFQFSITEYSPDGAPNSYKLLIDKYGRILNENMDDVIDLLKSSTGDDDFIRVLNEFESRWCTAA